MSADIEKLAVFDSRIVQSRPKYAVEKGALSLTNAPFNAIAATGSQHTYNIYVPSENVYVDRALEWSSTCFQTFTVGVGGLLIAAGDPIVVAGRDFALRSFPLNALCSTLTATINDTTTVINTQDVLDPVLRLADYKKNRLQRTCPTMLDKYASYNDAAGTIANPLAGYENATESAEVPNGAFLDLIYTDNVGNPLPTALTSPAFGGANYDALNGVPVYNAALNPGSAAPYAIFVRWRSTEKLVLSPFVFADCHEWDTGLFGINNIQLIMNMRLPDRTLRFTARGGRIVVPNSITYNTAAPGGTGFQASVVNVQFLTPSLDVPLPPKSVVPYMEFPRYITQASAQQIIPAGGVGQIQSQTITLPQIPDLFIIYVKPDKGMTPGATSIGPTDGDFYLPVATGADGVRNPININFDNFSGLLSSQTAEQLYGMSVKNGLEMDYNQWAGLAHVASSVPGQALTGGRAALTGGLLILKPSQDITLQSGQAPSLVGNFTFQFNLQIKNNTPNPQQPSLFVITANSGFFESIRGSSRIIKGVLSEQDIISAPVAPMGTRDMLQRHVGGAFNFANMLSKAKDIYSATKPAVSMAKGLLPSGMARDALGAVGYGSTGAGSTGAGSTGAGSTGAGRMTRRMM
jgi:hypothetical protein